MSSFLTGMAITLYSCNQPLHSLLFPSKQTCQAHGVVVHTSMDNNSHCSGHLIGYPPLSWQKRWSQLCWATQCGALTYLVFLMWQLKCSSCLNKGINKEANCYALTMIPLVFHSLLWHSHYCHSYSWGSYLNDWLFVEVSNVFFLYSEPTGLQLLQESHLSITITTEIQAPPGTDWTFPHFNHHYYQQG